MFDQAEIDRHREHVAEKLVAATRPPNVPEVPPCPFAVPHGTTKCCGTTWRCTNPKSSQNEKLGTGERCERCPDKRKEAELPHGKEAPKPEGATPIKLRLTNSLALGDATVMTAVVRDLHAAHPGKYATDVRTNCGELWEHNPLVTTFAADEKDVQEHVCQYPAINQSTQRQLHFIHGYHEDLSAKLGVPIPVTKCRGDLYVSDEEKGWMSQVGERGHHGPFWVMVAGGKTDFTGKWWPPSYYQHVVDHFEGRLKFAQVGCKNDRHPKLRDVIDLVGQTNVRELIRLIWNADGVVCPVTGAMHIAAALPLKDEKPRGCVVIAGAREPAHWEQYAGHQFLQTVGTLACCRDGACWRSRCERIGDGDEKDKQGMCLYPENVAGVHYPRCMTTIKPHDVIRGIERYYESGALRYQ